MIEYTVKVYDNGSKEWLLNGKRHREDGPAVEHICGDNEWFLNGLRHRVDGPAMEYADGFRLWCLNGKILRDKIEWVYPIKKTSKKSFLNKTKPVKELTIAEIEALLGHRVKVVK